MFRKIIIVFFLLTFIFNSSLARDEYFLTLRNDKVNLRQGPSFDYHVKIFYEKKFLPVMVVDQSENFKKIIDHENNSGWIHISQLSKKKAAITKLDKVILFKRPTRYSKPLAVLEKGRLMIISKCKDDWCKVQVENFKGWVDKKKLWGRL